MKAIIGLGNPGKEYVRTRHNVGFLVMDQLSKNNSEGFRSKNALEAEISEIEMKGERVLLVKPQTFMNASGRTLAAVLSKYPVTIEDVLVVYDDADLSFADVRVKSSGSSAGHRGMESILNILPKRTNVTRVRVGIGRPAHPDIPLDKHVLQAWTDQEEEALPGVIDQTISLILNEWL
ncbi:aminoacyl-tRNA hydrolase [Candidatus Uhrbacteria bacterium]|nr:aminoacyl-tRNA hydrolase [Candidatus Uhrbacteria bacterium]